MLQAKTQCYQERLAHQNDVLKDLEAALAGKDRLIAQYKEQLVLCKEQVAVLQKELGNWQRKTADAGKELETCRTGRATLAKENSELRKELEGRTAEFAEEVAGYKSQLEERDNHVASLTERTDALVEDALQRQTRWEGERQALLALLAEKDARGCALAAELKENKGFAAGATEKVLLLKPSFPARKRSC